MDATGANGAAGEIDITSGGRAILRADIDASAATGFGILCIAALSDITLDTPGAPHADGRGGCISLCAGRDVLLGSPLVSAASTSTLSGNDGGALCVLSGRNIAANGPVNVSAAGPNGGGMIDIEADRDLAIGGAATLDADGGQVAGHGGAITLVAGGFGFPGDATLNGQAHARGSAPAGAVEPAAASLTGCTVHVGSTGLLDTRGDARARNTLVARTGLRLDAGALIATTGVDPMSRNFVTLPAGAATPSPGAFSPPLVSSDVQLKPVCTGPNQPVGCLIPCPSCGNGQVEFPETCDNGFANGPCQPCDANCRTFTCDDRNPCTTDTCDVLAGCVHTLIAGCTTTTTTTLPPPVPCGDVNGDGVVNIGDALLVAQVDVGLRSCSQLPHPEVCDVNRDGACNIGDALRLAQCDVGLVGCTLSLHPVRMPIRNSFRFNGSRTNGEELETCAPW